MGGVATSAGRISRSLAAMDCDVDVIAWTRSLQPGVVAHEDAHEDGAPSIYRMGRYREWDATMPHTLNLFDWLCTKHTYQAIWGHYLSPGGFLATWFGRLKNIPTTVSVRGNDLDRDMYPPGDFSRLHWTLNNATCISAVTQDLAAKVTALCGRQDVVWLKNVVDANVFFPISGPSLELRGKLGIRPDEIVLGFAGELREKKGQHFLLDALRILRETRPVCLLIIGEVRPSEMPRLMQWTGAGALEDHRVLVTGQLATPSEVNQHLQLCDVYLQPSLWDGMPNALLEAMAAGCGCIGSDAGGIPEAIDNGTNGIILPRWQLHRLPDAVLEWMSSPPEYRDRIRQAARDRAIADYGPAVERRQLQSILERLIPIPA
jgi:glycosyltransferase involved in cell wall biosynthesis